MRHTYSDELEEGDGGAVLFGVLDYDHVAGGTEDGKVASNGAVHCQRYQPLRRNGQMVQDRGRYSATSGTLEMGWLNTVLMPSIAPTEVSSNFRACKALWKIPDCHTLSMSTNMAATKMSVY